MPPKNYKSKDYKIARLCRAIQSSLESQENFRYERLQVVKKAAGNHWGDLGGEGTQTERRFINFLAQFRSIISRQLVPKNPRVMVSTFAMEGRAVTDSLETWANRHFEKIYLGETLQRVAVDALDSIGIIMVALADPLDAHKSGYETQAGEPFCKRIDMEDFVFDNRCKDFREAEWMGHFHRCSVEAANELYIKGKKDRMEADDPTDYNPQGDEKVGIFGRGQHVDNDEYEEKVGLWDIYLRKEGVIVTLRSGDDGMPIPDKEPLAVTKWVGPPCGPYHILGFGFVPGNAMPSAPAQHLVDLDELLNKCLQKLADQAGNQKEFTAIEGQGSEDGDRIMAVNDGDVIGVDSVESIQQVRMGGPDQVNFAFALKVLDWANRQAGNIDTLAGLATAAGTARQEQLIANNASQGIVDMLDTTLTFIQSVVSAYLWLHYHHPYEVLEAPYQVEGYPAMSTIREVTPQERYEVPWDRLELRVDPFAAQHQTPQQKMAFVNAIVDRMIPLTPILAPQGVFFDAPFYTNLMAKWSDTPELSQIFAVRAPMPQQMQGEGGAPGLLGGMMGGQEQGGAGTGSEKSDAGQDEALIQKLLGGSPGGDPNASPSLVSMP